MTKEEAIIEQYNLLWRQEGFWYSDEFMEKLINHPKVIEEYNKRRLEELNDQ